ncbi:hypothetical protein Ssi02_74130 [Sinosporangium siamense]|uniref:Uncharacterized protein n=1 Tax=Sinosporangium siamense TaxID=1367973 RepID=A0A919RQ19_9ACTN|nr:hypothetical protein Ssi02_74130 [Sinosporangium siamense]
MSTAAECAGPDTVTGDDTVTDNTPTHAGVPAQHSNRKAGMQAAKPGRKSQKRSVERREDRRLV